MKKFEKILILALTLVSSSAAYATTCMPAGGGSAIECARTEPPIPAECQAVCNPPATATVTPGGNSCTASTTAIVNSNGGDGDGAPARGTPHAPAARGH